MSIVVLTTLLILAEYCSIVPAFNHHGSYGGRGDHYGGGGGGGLFGSGGLFGGGGDPFGGGCTCSPTCAGVIEFDCNQCRPCHRGLVAKSSGIDSQCIPYEECTFLDKMPTSTKILGLFIILLLLLLLALALAKRAL